MNPMDDKDGIAETFDSDFDTWVADGKPDYKQIVLGTTPYALISIGIDEKKIIWDTSKLNRIQIDHPDMTDNVLRQIPNIISNPIIIMESITRANRITLYGEVCNNEGIPVMVALELMPSGRTGKQMDDTIRVASAYVREGGISAVQSIINNSKVLYVCSIEKRTDTWLSHNKLQLPLEITEYGSIDKVTYLARDVNGNLSFSSDNSNEDEALPEWKAKLQEFDINDSNSEVHEPIYEYKTYASFDGDIDSWVATGISERYILYIITASSVI